MERKLLLLGISENIIGKASKLILATRSHLSEPDDFPTQILQDADLSILGASPKIYARYATAIRHEYGFVPDDAYRAGRRAVLERFLARPKIFYHQIRFADLEKQARANLIEEIHSLSARSQRASSSRRKF